MSRARACATMSSSAAAGTSPGRASRRTPSRKTMSVGIDRMSSAPARSGCAWVSTFPHMMSGCRAAAASKIGANARHGPHQLAQKSRMTIPSLRTCSTKSSVVIGTGFTTPSQRVDPRTKAPPCRRADAFPDNRSARPPARLQGPARRACRSLRRKVYRIRSTKLGCTCRLEPANLQKGSAVALAPNVTKIRSRD